MIGKAISKAIKNQNWLAIEYQNKENDITNYWIAIQDIHIDYKSFSVSAFNVAKMGPNSSGVIDIVVYFDQIQSANALPNTHYNQPSSLLEKIETNLEKLAWLAFDTYSDSILDYLYECMIHEETPYQKETALVRQIDQDALESLKKDEKYPLSLEQIGDLVPKIERLAKQEKKGIYEVTTLIINLFSIATKKGLFVVAYKELAFNPIEKSIVLASPTLFNYTFACNTSQNYRHHLKNYLDIETDDFISLFLTDPLKAKAMLEPEVLKRYESLDERPYIMDMVRSYYAHIEKEMDQIKLQKKNNLLSTPLKAFFGNMTGSLLKGRTRAVDVVLLDNNINIDQLRVVFNALTKPITYVQGPPGTGKTHTIISVLISAFFNDDKVLVSSNNNKPINDIYDKITKLKSQNKEMFLPFIRLGNKEETLKSLLHIKTTLAAIQRFKVEDEKLEKNAKASVENMKKINKILFDYEDRIELEEQLDALLSMKNNLKTDLRGIIIEEMIQEKEKKLSLLKKADEEDIKKYVNQADPRFMTWLFFTGIKNYKRIFEPKNEQLLHLLDIENEETKFREFNLYLKEEKNFSNFQKIFPIILTTNQSAFRLGPQMDFFDLVVLDEAGQSSIGYSLFPIARAKRLLLVGDQNQLKPVITMAPENNRGLMRKYEISDNYDYVDNSILLTMQKVDTISKFVLLRYHYRSHKAIINFSNKKYYNNQLILPLENAFAGNALEHIHVNSKPTPKPFEKNTSLLEAAAIVQDIKKNGYENVGIITPFRNQANLIEATLKEAGLENINVGTIHTFQGDEKNIIYLSSAVTKHTYPRSFDWVRNNQELINVATTRAKNKFILVSDENEITKRSPAPNDFYELLQYVTKNGKEVALTKSNPSYFVNGANYKNYDTKKEKEFFDTINHLLTTSDKYVMKSKVRIATIFDGFKTEKEYDFSLKGEFDLVIFKSLGSQLIPILIIELDGNEHKEDQKVIRRDKIKQDICVTNNIQLIRIDNKYSRRYLYIKDLLIPILS